MGKGKDCMGEITGHCELLAWILKDEDLEDG